MKLNGPLTSSRKARNSVVSEPGVLLLNSVHVFVSVGSLFPENHLSASAPELTWLQQDLLLTCLLERHLHIEPDSI